MSTRVKITLDFNKDSDAVLFGELAKLSSYIDDIDDMFLRNVEIYKYNDNQEEDN